MCIVYFAVQTQVIFSDNVYAQIKQLQLKKNNLLLAA